MQEKCVFRLYAEVLFNRAVDTVKDYISPGGFTFVMGGETICFDFQESSVSVKGNTAHIEMKNPDYESFPDLEKVTPKMLKNVTSIEDFFVFTGEEGETDLKPFSLKSVTFVLPYEKWFHIPVKRDVVAKYSFI